LFFCTQCGAAQVRVADDVLTAVAAEGSDERNAAEATPVPPQIWRTALHCVGGAALLAAGLAASSAVLPPVVLLAWLWAVVSPVVVIGLLQAREPRTAMSAGLGARLGLLTGLAIAAVMSAVNAATLLTMRHMGAMGDFDGRMNTMIASMRVQALAQPENAAAVTPLLNALALPEFRAGMLLGGLAMGLCFLLAITTAGGAFAGFVRSRQRS
jgi:hypothetical protein